MCRKIRCDRKSETFCKIFGEVNKALVHPKTKNFLIFLITSNIATHAYSIKYRRKQKLIAQFVYKSRDKSFEPN